PPRSSSLPYTTLFRSHRLTRAAIERGHETNGVANGPMLIPVLFRRRRDNPDAERLRQNKRISRLGTRIADDAVGVNDAGHGEPKIRSAHVSTPVTDQP